MNFMKLITITERTARDIDRMTSVVLHGEHDTVPGIRQDTIDPVLVQVKWLQIWVEKQSSRLEIHR